MEPYWALRGGLVPFCMVFNKQASAWALTDYLDHTGTFDEILMMLFSHGVESMAYSRSRNGTGCSGGRAGTAPS